MQDTFKVYHQPTHRFVCREGAGMVGKGGKEGGREDGEDSHYTNGDAYRYQRVR